MYKQILSPSMLPEFGGVNNDLDPIFCTIYTCVLSPSDEWPAIIVLCFGQLLIYEFLISSLVL